MKRLFPSLMTGSIKWLFLFLLAVNQLQGQSLEDAFNSYAKTLPREKIYLHCDRNIYVAGETIWFKAYLFYQRQPGLLSNNIYIQLIDANGSIRVQQKYPVMGATARGQITIPDSLAEGQYHLRAITPLMLNLPRELDYYKPLYVLRAAQTPGQVMPDNSIKNEGLNIRFFPEGGNLVEEHLSLLAFEATDLTGLPQNIEGFIRADDGTTICSFKTFREGIGRFQFRPVPGKKYLAVVSHNGQESIVPLPAVKSTGVSIRVEPEKGGKKFQVSRSRKNKELFDQVSVVVVMGQEIIYENEINFDNFPSVIGHLLTDSMPSGLLRFTVLNKDRVPIAERLTFVNNAEYADAPQVEKMSFSGDAGQENSVVLRFADQVQRSLSVSVVDKALSPQPVKDNMITSFLLTSELREYMDDPWSYLSDHSDTTAKALDNLLLTHGWKGYDWKEILNPREQRNRYADNYLVTLTGRALDRKSKQQAGKGTLLLFVESEENNNSSFQVPVDKEGRFRVDSLLVYGSTKIEYSYSSEQGKEKPVDIILDPVPADAAVAQELPGIPGMDNMPWLRSGNTNNAVDQLKKNYLDGQQQLEKVKELSPVIIESRSSKRPVEMVNEKYASGVFRAMGKVNIDNINEPVNDKTINVYDYIRNNIKQVEIQEGKFVNRRNFSLTQGKEFSLAQVDKETKGNVDEYMKKFGNSAGKKFTVGLFLNEVPAEPDFLKSIQMQDVALLKFYEPGFVGAGSSGPGGVIAIYTKERVAMPEKATGLSYILYKGYSITKQFYTPLGKDNEKMANRPTRRNTVHWQSDILLNTDQTEWTLTFPNENGLKELKLILEGFDAKGRLIFLETILR